MAKLDELVESLNVKLATKTKTLSHESNEKVSGHKRRSWLVEENENGSNEEIKGVYRPLNEKGSIDPIYKPHLSTPLINPVYRPLLKKESKGVYKPLNISLPKLRGNPLKITQYIFELLRNDIDKTTGKVTLMEIMKKLDLSKDSARTGLRFLLKNRLLERIDFQAGKFGWSKYRIKNELLNDLYEAYLKGSIDPLSLKGSNNSSSYNNITTTDRPLLDWDNIDVDPLESIGLNKKHLLQLKSKNLPEITQESINHFAYGLKYNPKTQKYTDPLTVLMGVLRKGEQWIEPSYQSPQEKALEKLLQEKKIRQQKVASMEVELMEVEFDAWYQTLTDKETEELTKNLVARSLPKSLQERAKRGCLINYFKNNIFKKQ